MAQTGILDLLKTRRSMSPSLQQASSQARSLPQGPSRNQQVHRSLRKNEKVANVLSEGQQRLNRTKQLQSEVNSLSPGKRRWQESIFNLDANTPVSRLERMEEGKQEMYADSLREDENRRVFGDQQNMIQSMFGAGAQNINTLLARGREIPETLRGTAAQLTGNDEALNASVKRQNEMRDSLYGGDDGLLGVGTIYDNEDEVKNMGVGETAKRVGAGQLDILSLVTGGTAAPIMKQIGSQGLKTALKGRGGRELAKMSASGASGTGAYDLATNKDVSPGSFLKSAVAGGAVGPVAGVGLPLAGRGAAKVTSKVGKGLKNLGEDGFIGGERATGFDKVADKTLAHMEKNMRNGVYEDPTAGNYGSVFQGPDGKFRFEVSDHKAKLKDVKLPEGKIFKLSDVLEHDALYKEYPHLKDLPIRSNSKIGDRVSASTDGKSIEFNPSTYREDVDGLIKDIMHEADHVIQDIEGFAPGGSPDFSRVPTKKEAKAIRARRASINQKLREIRARAAKSGKMSKEDKASMAQLMEERRRLPKSRIAEKQKAAEEYTREAGEVQSRTVEKRLRMTPAERAKRPFYDDADVPPHNQKVSKPSNSQKSNQPRVSMKRVDDRQISLLDDAKPKPKMTYSKEDKSFTKSGGDNNYKVHTTVTDANTGRSTTLDVGSVRKTDKGWTSSSLRTDKNRYHPSRNAAADAVIAKQNESIASAPTKPKVTAKKTAPPKKSTPTKQKAATKQKAPDTTRAHGKTIKMTPENGYQPVKTKDGGVIYKKTDTVGSNVKGDRGVETRFYDANGTKLTRAQADGYIDGRLATTKPKVTKKAAPESSVAATKSIPKKPTQKPKVSKKETAKPKYKTEGSERGALKRKAKTQALTTAEKSRLAELKSKKQSMNKKYQVEGGKTKERSVSKRAAKTSGNKNVKVQTYKGLNEKAQEAAGKRLVQEDYNYAQRVAMGEANPPGNLQSGKVYNAVMEKALDNNDQKLMDKLTERSVLAKEATEAGQFSSSFRGGMAEDPVKAILDVQRARQSIRSNPKGKISKAGLKKLPKGVTAAEKKQVYDLASKARKASKKMNKKNGRFKNEADRLAYGRAMYDLRNFTGELTRVGFKSMSKIDKARALAGATKSLRATLDNSALGNQTGKVMWTNPRTWLRNARKSFVDLYKRFGGKDMQRELMADIMSRENYVNGKYKQLGIDVGVTEEAYPISLDIRPQNANNKVSKTFGHTLGRAYGASEAAFVGLQRRNRADIADTYIGVLEKAGNKQVLNSKDEMRSVGRMINALTGRGNLGRAEHFAKDINVAFFSLKLAKSQLDVLTQPLTGAPGQTGGAGSNFVRKQAAKNLTKMMAGYATVLGIADAVSPGSVEWDPRSADFGRIKVGNTRYSVAPGLSSTIVLLSRLGHHAVNTINPDTTAGSFKSTTTGVVTPFADADDPLSSFTAASLLGNFFENKISPVARTGLNWATGKDWEGEPWDVKSLPKDLTVPISLEQAFEDFKRDDMSGMNKIASIIATHSGWFSSSWGDVEGWDKKAAEDRQNVDKMARDLSKKEKHLYRSLFMSYDDEEAGKQPTGAESLDRTANRYKTLTAHPDILEIFKTQERQNAERGDPANPLFLKDMDKKDPNHEVSRMERVMRYRASRDLNAAKQTYTKDGEPLFTELGLDSKWYDDFRKKEGEFFDKIMEDNDSDEDGRRMTYSGMKYPEPSKRQAKLQDQFFNLPTGDGPRGGNQSRREFLNDTKEGQELLEFWAERDHFTNAERIAIGLKPILKDEDGNVIDSKTGQPKTSYGSSGGSGGGGSGGRGGRSSVRHLDKYKYAVSLRGSSSAARPKVTMSSQGRNKTVSRKPSTAKPKVTEKKSKV